MAAAEKLKGLGLGTIWGEQNRLSSVVYRDNQTIDVDPLTSRSSNDSSDPPQLEAFIGCDYEKSQPPWSGALGGFVQAFKTPTVTASFPVRGSPPQPSSFFLPPAPPSLRTAVETHAAEVLRVVAEAEKIRADLFVLLQSSPSMIERPPSFIDHLNPVNIEASRISPDPFKALIVDKVDNQHIKSESKAVIIDHPRVEQPSETEPILTVMSSTPSLQGIPPVYRRAIEKIAVSGFQGVRWAGGWSVLHWAAQEGRSDLVCWLMKKGADPLTKDQRGRSSVDVARDAGKEEILDVFRKKQFSYKTSVADVPAVIRPAKGPVSKSDGLFSANRSLPAAFEAALQAIAKNGWGAVKWAAGWTALHWAAQEGRLDVVTWLVEQASAPAYILDEAGKPPIYYAQQRGMTDVVQYLSDCENRVSS